MNNKFIFFLLLVVFGQLFGYNSVNQDEYSVKAGDKFLVQIFSADTLSKAVPVLPGGKISLFPFIEPVEVAGKTINEAIKVIIDELNRNLKNSSYVVELLEIAPVSFHITGLVVRPGQYLTEIPISLNQALLMAGNLLPNASRKITISRNGKMIICDLDKYYLYGDLSNNPMIMHDDILITDYAKNFVKVYVNTDTINYTRYVELEESTDISEVIRKLEYKQLLSNYSDFTVLRNNTFLKADRNFALLNDDVLNINLESMFVNVGGSVKKPGRFSYSANSTAHYYIGMAGGLEKTASKIKIYVIDKDGIKTRYKGDSLRPGDTLFVPESFYSNMSSYLAPIASLASIITTVILISDKITQ